MSDVTALRFHLHSAGVLAPGISSLAELRAVVLGERSLSDGAQTQVPVAHMLPANERRRASLVARLTLGCIEQALQDHVPPWEPMRSVFAMDEGTGDVCQHMLDSLGAEPQVSPLLFPNSVHNAPSGYFSIDWRNRQASSVVSLGQESFCAGLMCAAMEAAETGRPVLLVAYDPAMTSPLDELHPVHAPIAVACLITAGEGDVGRPPGLASFELVVRPGQGSASGVLPAWLPQGWLANSSASALAMLGLLDAGCGTVHGMRWGGLWVDVQRV